MAETQKSEIKSYSTAIQEVPVTIDGKAFVLRQMNGTEKGKFLQAMGPRVIINEKGKFGGFRDYTKLDETVLTYTLFEVVDGEHRIIPVNVLETWPAAVLSDLSMISRRMSGLTEEGEKELREEAKND